MMLLDWERQPQALRWLRPLAFATACSAVALALLVCFLAFGLPRRAEAEAAANLRGPLTWLLAAVALAPLVWSMFEVHALKDFLDRDASRAQQTLVVGACLTVAAALLLPWLVAANAREERPRPFLVWRGNLRRSLPPLIAVACLTAFAFHVVVARERADWVRYWWREGRSEMTLIKHTLGPAWDHPAIPAGAWRAEYPPNVPKN